MTTARPQDSNSSRMEATRPDLGPLARELFAVRASGTDYVLFGSIVMALHGIPRRPSDIDVFVTERVYDALRRRGWGERYPNPEHPPLLEWMCGDTPVNAWFRWYDHHLGEDTPSLAFESAGPVRGWNCQGLGLLADWKCIVPIPKHARDVDLIYQHLYGDKP